MTQKLLLSLLSCCLFIVCQAQDRIIRKTGDTILCRITDASSREIRYKREDTVNATQYSLLKSHVALIQYQDGHTDSMREASAQPALTGSAAQVMADPYTTGIKDASNNYYGSGAAATGTLITSLLSPIAGLIPAIACSSTTPSRENLGYRDEASLSNPEYTRGYLKEARAIKQRRIWKNWGIGFGINLVLAVFVLAQ